MNSKIEQELHEERMRKMALVPGDEGQGAPDDKAAPPKPKKKSKR